MFAYRCTLFALPSLPFSLSFFVTPRYEDLLREGEDLAGVAERAFGREGLGIAAVSGVPDIAEARRELFELGHK